MYYLNTETNEYPITESFIRSQFKNTSFSAIFNAPHPYALVTESVKPAFDPLSERLVEVAPAQTETGWQRSWQVQPLSEEAIQKNKDRQHKMQSANVRMQRNELLKQSDWTQGKDVPDEISTACAEYRQALRDITKQPGFPFGVIWPNTPAALQNKVAQTDASEPPRLRRPGMNF